MGILESLWQWAAKFAIQGDIGKWSDDAIAQGIRWRKSPTKLVQALLNAGWIDEAPAPHRLVIHDLADHADNTWRQALERAGLPFWDGTSPRSVVGRPHRKSHGNSTATPQQPNGASSQGGNVIPPSLPSLALPSLALPSLALPEPSLTEPDRARRKNPLVDRARDEPECLRMVAEVAEITGEDGTEVIKAASDFKGHGHVNPANMSDDRLAHAMNNLRQRLRQLKAPADPPRPKPWEGADLSGKPRA